MLQMNPTLNPIPLLRTPLPRRQRPGEVIQYRHGIHDPFPERAREGEVVLHAVDFGYAGVGGGGDAEAVGEAVD